MAQIISIDTPSLDDRSYLLSDGPVAFVVDPQRDIDPAASPPSHCTARSPGPSSPSLRPCAPPPSSSPQHSTPLDSKGLPMDYDLTVTLELPHEQAVPAVRAALKQQGFGILTEIDVKATMREKLDVETEPYIILGACNPPLAHQALEIDRTIGLLLPCNVVVRAADDQRTFVQALNPEMMTQVTERAELLPVATEAAKRIRAALDTLTAHEK